MKEVWGCLAGILLILLWCTFVAGLVCLGLSLIWLAFGVANNVTLAYVGFGLAIGGGACSKLLAAFVKD